MNLFKYKDIKQAKIEQEKKVMEESFLLALTLRNFNKVIDYIHKGVDVNVQGEHSISALRFFCSLDKKEYRKDIIELLLNHGADINLPDKDGITPIMWAIMKENVDLVKYLIENKADLNIKDNKGRNVEYWAQHYPSILELLNNAKGIRLQKNINYPNQNKAVKNSGIF